MLPFRRQVGMTCDHAKFAAARLSGHEAPRFEDNETDLRGASGPDREDPGVHRVRARGGLRGGRGADDQHQGRAARADASRRSEYLANFAMPNFYFHMTTAYNILRHNGVEIGKRDFLGG